MSNGNQYANGPLGASAGGMFMGTVVCDSTERSGPFGFVDSEAILLNAPTSLTPPYPGDMCVTAWHRITGYGDYAYLTLNVNAAGSSTNSAEWRPSIPTSGEYQVLAFVPDHPPID